MNEKYLKVSLLPFLGVSLLISVYIFSYWLRRLVYTPGEPTVLTWPKGKISAALAKELEAGKITVNEARELLHSEAYNSELEEVNNYRIKLGLIPFLTLNPAVPERKTEPPAPPAEPKHTSKG